MKTTRIILLIYIGIVAILPTCYLQQIVNVSGLLSHYQHHVSEHENVSFLDFLVVHYAEQYHHEDGDNHKETPLSSSAQNGNTHVVFGFIPSTILMNLEGNNIHLEIIKIPAIAHQNLISDFFLSIWKPPKLERNA